MSERKGPEKIRSTIKGSIQVAIWERNATLVKGFKRKDSDEWENKEISLWPEEIDAAIEVLEQARARFADKQEADRPRYAERSAAPERRQDNWESKGNDRFRR